MPPHHETDLIDVRLDERFDEGRLSEYLRGKLANAEGKMTVRQFDGGKANLTYQLSFGKSHEYVLRRPPLGPVAPSAHDMGREYRVLSVLHKALPVAPQAFLYCDDADVVGAPFVIMERCNGIVIRDTMPEQYARDADAPRKLSESLVDGMADFHSVDYVALGLSELGRPAGFVKRQVDGWGRRWERAKLEDDPQVDEIHNWLAEHLPANSQFSLVHNDYKLDNAMFDADDPSRLVAVLDWDMCTLGDPLSDLGTLLTYWRQPDDPSYLRLIATMPRGDYAFLTRRQVVERYADNCDIDIADMQFYHALGIYRLLVILQQIYIRYVRGQTQDKRFAQMGDSVAALTRWALDVTRGSVDYV